MAGPQGLSCTLLLQRLQQIPTVQCTTAELMSALKKVSLQSYRSTVRASTLVGQLKDKKC